MTTAERISTAKGFTSEWGAYFASSCPELGKIPKNWAFLTDGETKQIFWISLKTGDVTATHPHYGPLPDNWIVRVFACEGNEFKARYYNSMTGEVARQDPRFSSTHLLQQSQDVSKDLRISAATTRNVGHDLREMHRQPIGNQDIRHHYEIVHTIDNGGGSLGGMNGGVFVVRLKGIAAKLYVEKRFPKKLVRVAETEIAMIHRLKHNALTMYTAAFITPTTASIYLEFCDRGSLNDMMKEYSKSPDQNVPEPFIWHAFIGICDGLTYLHTGGEGSKDWIPILHRDLKPDNILLRSRSTVGSTKYPYCILSDFGLAVEDRQRNDPKVDKNHKFAGKCGSKMWWAPEMLYSPYPKTKAFEPISDIQFRSFPDGHKHTKRSDVWALGASMYNLCRIEGITKSFIPMAHLVWPAPKEYAKANHEHYLEGVVSRKQTLAMSKSYSPYLDQAVKYATTWKLKERPDAAVLLRQLRKLNLKSGFSTQASAKNQPLPDWSTRVHEYGYRGQGDNR